MITSTARDYIRPAEGRSSILLRGWPFTHNAVFYADKTRKEASDGDT